MAAQKTARASPELRKGSTQPALPSVLHHHPGHKRVGRRHGIRNRHSAIRRIGCEYRIVVDPEPLDRIGSQN